MALLFSRRRFHAARGADHQPDGAAVWHYLARQFDRYIGTDGADRGGEPGCASVASRRGDACIHRDLRFYPRSLPDPARGLLPRLLLDQGLRFHSGIVHARIFRRHSVYRQFRPRRIPQRGTWFESPRRADGRIARIYFDVDRNEIDFDTGRVLLRRVLDCALAPNLGGGRPASTCRSLRPESQARRVSELWSPDQAGLKLAISFSIADL